MASNTLTNIQPKILAAGLLALREQAIMPRLVNTDYGSDARQKGSTVDIPVPKTQTAADVTPAPTPSSAQGNTPGLVQLTLNQWKHADFFLTDKEMAEIERNRHYVPMQQSEAVRALANSADTHVHSKYTGIYGYVGTAAVTPFSTVATAANARKVLNEQLAPNDPANRHIVMDPDAEAQALQLSAYSDLEKTGDRAVKIDGELGRKFGLNHFMSQNVQTHTAGTAASVVINAAASIGVSTIVVSAQDGAGTILVGDVFTIAGDTQTYVSKTSVSLSSTAASITIDPPIKVLASAGDALTLKATHVVNLAFHRNAFAFATRPLMTADSGRNIFDATDPMTGLSLRLELINQYKQDAWDFDILYGAQLVRAELATRIAG